MRSSTSLAGRLGLVTCLFTLGCGSATTRANPFDPSAIPNQTAAEDPIRVEVQNINFNDVTVWAIRQGQRVRVGSVTGKSDRTFRIPWNVAVPISFEIDVIGGRGCRTQQISVEREARVWLTIPSAVGRQPCQIGRR